MSFVSEDELATHVKVHREARVPSTELALTSPPQDLVSQCGAHLGVQGSHDLSQGASPVSGDAEGEDCDPEEPALVVVEETGDKVLRGTGPVKMGQRGSGAGQGILLSL